MLKEIKIEHELRKGANITNNEKESRILGFKGSGSQIFDSLNPFYSRYSFIRVICVLICLLMVTSCSKWGVDLEPPEVESYSPQHNQYGVPNNATIWIKFNEDMNKTSVENAFSLQSQGDINGQFSWESRQKVVYMFEKGMTTGKQYSVTLGKTAKDETGNEMTRNFIFSFYVNNDIGPPQVIKTIPQNLGTMVNRNSDIYLYFSEAMDVQTVQNNFSISPSVNGLYQWVTNNTILRYHLTEDMLASTRYNVALGADASDLQGNKLGQEYKFNFLTGDSYDSPEILGVYRYGDTRLPIPLRYLINYQTNINKNVEIAIHFNKPMSHSDVEKAFSLSPSVSGYFTWSTSEGETLIFHPTSYLEIETTYKLSMSSSAKDLDGHPLSSDYELFFIVNSINSRYLQITNVRDNLNNTLLPDIINNVNLQGHTTNTFTVLFNIETPNQIDIISFQENVSISRISGFSNGSSGAIYDFFYNGNLTQVYLKLGDLKPNNYYKLQFNGGATGIKDFYQNYLMENKEIIFLTQ